MLRATIRTPGPYVEADRPQSASSLGRVTHATERAAVLVAAVLLALGGCGREEDPPGGASPRAGNGADRAFVADMVPHHQSAVQMAEIARRRGESAFVWDLATGIARTQEQEIAAMRREDAELEEAGVKRGTLGVADHMNGMDMDASGLKTARSVDRAFLEMMIPHHQGAVAMARAELEEGADPELKALAREVIAGQEREIAAMREHLGRAAGVGGPGEGHAGH